MGLLNKIHCVVVLGVRTAEQTKIFATHNYSIYCLMVEYENGHRELVECNSKEMGKYLPYIYVS